MKKFLLLLLLSPQLLFAQFTLVEGGLKVTDSDNDYIVYDFEGVSSQELYNRAKNAVISTFVSAKDVATENENEMISVNAVSNKEVYIKQMGIITNFIVNYNIRMRFKDGKVRVDLPIINYIKVDGPQLQNVYLTRGSNGMVASSLYVYKKNGDLRYKDFKSSFEKLFNRLITNLIDNIRNNNEKDNW